MTINWNFSDYNHGRRQGISDSGVETFRGNRYRHLAKEICQNSLDAVKEGNKTVKVEFQHFKIDKQEIPGHERYLEVFNQCYESSKSGSAKVRDFFTYSKKILADKKISVLRISDFNTEGLTGSKKERDTSWNDLIKAAGISNKGGDAGGSFGIGKYAAFACSNLRTVFYSTLDEDGIEASQGVAELINFIDKNGSEKEGEGYYGEGERNSPIFNQLDLDPNFRRGRSIGTDIYIIGFIEQEDWAESIIYSVIDSFLIAIYNGTLEVKVGDTKIDKSSLDDIVKNKLDYSKSGRNRNSLEFYKVLTSEETVVKTFSLNTSGGSDLGKFEVHLLVDNEFTSRRVLMSRINGMKVFEQDRFPRGIPFSGICILLDKDINDYFRKMETPEHDAWRADQFSEDPKEISEANKTRLNLVRLIREELNILAKETTLDETDVGDLGMLLPDLQDDFLGSKGMDESTEKDNANAEINIKLEEDSPKNDNPVYKEEPGDGDFDPKGQGKGGGKSTFGDGRNGVGRQRVVTNSFSIRMFQISTSKYRMLLKSKDAIEGVEVLISAVGEDKSTKLNIGINSAFDKTNNKGMLIKDKRIIIGNTEKEQNYKIDFSPDIYEQLSMEVVIYAT